jgi:hypothetical protein
LKVPNTQEDSDQEFEDPAADGKVSEGTRRVTSFRMRTGMIFGILKSF